MFSRLFSLSVISIYLPLSSVAYAQEQVLDYETAEASDILFSLEKADESQQPVSGTSFTASAQLGFLYLTGNTRSADIKTGLDLRFERGLWRSFFIVDVLVKKTEQTTLIDDGSFQQEFDTTEQKWSLSSQTNYTVDARNKNYVYGSIYYEENRFSSFDSQASVSGGWGRRWYENQHSSFDADIGPGFKRDVPQVTPEDIEKGISPKTQDTIILQAQALYIRKINEHIEFKQQLVVKHAIEKGQNSIYKAESSITSKLIESLQLKLNFIVDYNSKVDVDKENFQTETSAVLIYSF